MRGDRFSLVAGLVVIAALLLGGCSNEAPTTPAAPAPTAVSPSPTASPEPTEPADEYAIPDDPADIDEAYVERVLEALSESTAAAAREVAREGRVNSRARRELEAAHRGDALKGIIAAFRRAVRTGEPETFFSADAKAVDVVSVDEIVTRTPSCLFVLVTEDTNPLGGQDVEPFATYYHLGTKDAGDDPHGRNPTPWMIVADGPPLRGGQEYEDPCQ